MQILSKNLNSYQALIFDFDGTLVNSMPFANIAWIEILSQFGVKIEESILLESAGLTGHRIVEMINQRYNCQLDPFEVARLKKQKYFENMSKVEPIVPLIEIVQKYYGSLPLGVITGGSHEVVDPLMEKLNLRNYFASVVCSDDTALGKDSPEPYLKCCEELSVSAKNCLFFDDGIVGLKAALAVGMDVIGVNINSPEIYFPYP